MTPLRLTAVLLSLLSIGASLTAQIPEPKCDWKQFQQNAADLRAARDAARRISETEGNTDVPPEAIKQIQQFKNSLYAALQDYFRCQPLHIPDTDSLQADLLSPFAPCAPVAPAAPCTPCGP
jgi:hypothetical protein